MNTNQEQIRKTCESIIDGRLIEREEEARGALEEAEVGLEPLGVMSEHIYTITLSWGGPADYIEVRTDEHGEVVSMHYIYQDWFDGARRPIEEGTYLWQYALETLGIE